MIFKKLNIVLINKCHDLCLKYKYECVNVQSGVTVGEKRFPSVGVLEVTLPKELEKESGREHSRASGPSVSADLPQPPAVLYKCIYRDKDIFNNHLTYFSRPVHF